MRLLIRKRERVRERESDREIERGRTRQKDMKRDSWRRFVCVWSKTSMAKHYLNVPQGIVGAGQLASDTGIKPRKLAPYKGGYPRVGCHQGRNLGCSQLNTCSKEPRCLAEQGLEEVCPLENKAAVRGSTVRKEESTV